RERGPRPRGRRGGALPFLTGTALRTAAAQRRFLRPARRSRRTLAAGAGRRGRPARLPSLRGGPLGRSATASSAVVGGSVLIAGARAADRPPRSERHVDTEVVAALGAGGLRRSVLILCDPGWIQRASANHRYTF